MFDLNREQSRQMFFNAWNKHKNQQVLEPIESMIVDVIQLHPEYHTFIEKPETTQDKDYFPETGETNPFLHMGLHIAIKEQLSINQPFGIKDQYNKLLTKHQDPHIVEHKIMECLAQMIWEAQRNNAFPDNQAYLSCLKSLS